CTANMHQGWPKFASQAWMRTRDGGLTSLAYAPCTIQTQVNGKRVQIEVETDYPFDETIKIFVHVPDAVRFPLNLRIPAWAKEAQVSIAGESATNVRAATFHRIERDWTGRAQVTLRLPMSVRVRRGYQESVSLE